MAMRIGSRDVGVGHAPFVIAEMSGNHNHSLQRALSIVDAAAEAGAHAIKIQTYTADTMTLNLQQGEFVIEDPGSLWYGRSLYELYEEAHTPWEWHEPIFERALERGIIPFSTPFDESAVQFLEELDVPCHKIASFENTDHPLLRAVASTGKPVLMSTGMASREELDESVTVLREAGCEDLVLLKCTSTYPAPPINSNLVTLHDLRRRYGCEVGLSDHSMGPGVAVAAVALGASVIEKHFTLARNDGGVDSAFSMEPEELRELVVESARAWQALGEVSYGPTAVEGKSLQFRRSLYVARDIQAGEVLTRENVRVIRPGFGLPPKHYDAVLGRKASRSVKMGTPLTWDMVE